MTDLEIARQFFAMLKKNGVKVIEGDDNGPEFTIRETIGYSQSTNNPEGDTLTFCFYREGGDYWRIMGFVGSHYTDEVHKDGWK